MKYNITSYKFCQTKVAAFIIKNTTNVKIAASVKLILTPYILFRENYSLKYCISLCKLQSITLYQLTNI